MAVLIQKEKKSCRALMLDSLGTADANTKEAQVIKNYFSKARLKCRWVQVQCRSQKEVECGPRTISVMVSIIKSLKGKIGIIEVISNATLMHVPEKEYDPSRIRRTAAACM